MEEIVFIASGLVIFGIHTYLASRKKVWLGAVIPTLYLISVVIFFLKINASLFSADIIPFSLFFTIMLGAWISRYESRKKKEKNELDKMKSRDLK